MVHDLAFYEKNVVLGDGEVLYLLGVPLSVVAPNTHLSALSWMMGMTATARRTGMRH